ncbi:MAG: DUF6290 family protein [Methylococcales bacterium]|jgi:predicted DNA-binding protein|nr:DUF6290 family protein [Methylococcales bacterium]
MLTLELNQTEEQEFLYLAEQQGKSINQLLKEIMQTYLEDVHDASLADAAMDDLISGKSTTVSFDEVKRQINALDD